MTGQGRGKQYSIIVFEKQTLSFVGEWEIGLVEEYIIKDVFGDSKVGYTRIHDSQSGILKLAKNLDFEPLRFVYYLCQKVDYVIEVFEKDPGDTLVETHSLRGIELHKLQDLFGTTREEPFYNAYRVRDEHVDTLTRHSTADIDLNRYDYFVTAES